MRPITILVLLVAVLTGILVATWFASPDIARRIAVDQGRSRGIEIDLQLERPGWTSLHIPRFTARSAEFSVTATGVTLTYDADSLRRTRLLSVTINTLEVHVTPGEDAAAGQQDMPSPWTLLPADSLHIDRFHVVHPEASINGVLAVSTDSARVHAELASPALPANLSFLAEVEPSGHIEITAMVSGERPALRIRSTPGTGAIGLDGYLVLSGRTLAMATRLVLDQQLTGSVSASFSGALPWPLPEPASLLASLSGTAFMTVDLAPAEPLLEFQGSLRTSLAEGRLVTTVEQTASVILLQDDTKVMVRVLEPFELATGVDSGRTSSRNMQLSLNLPYIELLDQTLGFRDARLRLTSLEFASEVLTLSGSLRASDNPAALPVRFDARLDLADPGAEFSATGQHQVSRALLKHELPGWQSPYDLDTGLVQFDIQGSLDSAFAIEAGGTISVADASVHYEDLTATGLSGDFDFSLQNGVLEVLPSAVRIGMIDVGFPVQKARFDIATDFQWYRIRQLDAEVLGGKVFIDNLDYQAEGGSADFDVVIRNLSLARLLALEGDDIQGEGILDGRIPVSLANDEPSVTAGSVTARPPGGRIRYLGSLPASAHAGLDLAAKALRDFRYTALHADIDYSAGGDLKTRVRLEGSSPNVENGRPIHFNLTITENIPVLLQSLQASDAFTERVQQKLSREQ